MSLSARRLFGTFSKVQGSSVLLSSQAPYKLRIQQTKDNFYDVTIKEEMSVKDFSARVVENCDGVSSFNIDCEDQEAKMGDITTSTFKFQANNKPFTAYPNLSTILSKQATSAATNQALAGRNLPQGRKQVLKEFLEAYMKQAGKELKAQNIQKDLEAAITAFKS
jgi:hypothetical protein